MPVTTILQHQREKEGLTQPDLDVPMTNDDHNLSMQDSIEEVRADWVFALKQHFRVSLLSKTEKAAATGRWVSPDSTYQSKLLNRRPNSNRPNAATLSTKQAPSDSYNARQTTSNPPITNERAVVPPQMTPSYGHYDRQMPPANYDSRLASHEIQHNRQMPRASYDARQISSTDHNTGLISPDVHEVAQRPVNALGIHIPQGTGTAPNSKSAWQPVFNTRINEQTAPRMYNDQRTPATSQSSAQTSPLNCNGGQASPTSYRTGHSSPVSWNAVQTSPEVQNAVGTGNRLGDHAMVSGAQPPKGRIYRPITSIQPHNPQTSNLQPAYPQPPAAPQRVTLLHSVTSSQPVEIRHRFAAPQPPMILHSTMASHLASPPQLAVVLQSARTSQQITFPQSVVTPRSAATSYPAIMPQPIVASQGMTAPQPPVGSQFVDSQPAYSQPDYSQPDYSQPRCTQSCCAQPAYSEPAYSQPYCSQPGCTQPECSQPAYPQPYHSQLAYSQPVTAPQQSNTSPPAATSQPLVASQSAMASNPPATTGPVRVLQRTTAPQPVYTQTWTTSPVVNPPQQENISRLADDYFHGVSRSRRSNRANFPQAQDPRSLYDPQESAIVGMTPSVGNKVVDYLMKRNPSVLAASQLSDTLPKADAVHYNSVLAWHAQNVGLIFPYEQSTQYNGIESQTVPSHDVLASREAQGVEPRTAHVNSTPASQQTQNTGASLHHGHSSASEPHNGVQSHSYSNAPSRRLGNGPNGCADRFPAPGQQSMNEKGKGKAVANSHGDIQEASQMDWQAANKENLGSQAGVQVASRQDWQAANREASIRQVRQKVQFAVVSPPKNKTSPSSASTSSVKPQNTPQPCVKKSKKKVSSLTTQRPIREKPAPAKAQAQATKKSAGQSQTSPVNGGVQKPKSSRVGRTTPPRTTPSSRRDQRPPVHVSGSGIRLTQEDVDRWQEERKNPYCLPSFKDAFGDIIMSNCSSPVEQTSSEPEGGKINLSAYRI